MTQTWMFGLFGGFLIGTASAILLLGNGRIAGVSGILGSIVDSLSRMGTAAEGLAFVAGLTGLPILYVIAVDAPTITVTTSAPLLLIGGLLVGCGTRLGSGCTSGHGVCGMSRLAPRSLLATGLFMATAAAMVYALRHVIGGI